MLKLNCLPLVFLGSTNTVCFEPLSARCCYSEIARTTVLTELPLPTFSPPVPSLPLLLFHLFDSISCREHHCGNIERQLNTYDANARQNAIRNTSLNRTSHTTTEILSLQIRTPCSARARARARAPIWTREPRWRRHLKKHVPLQAAQNNASTRSTFQSARRPTNPTFPIGEPDI